MLNKQTDKMPSRLIPERQHDDLNSSDDELPEFALPPPEVIYIESDEDSDVDSDVEDNVEEIYFESDEHSDVPDNAEDRAEDRDEDHAEDRFEDRDEDRAEDRVEDRVEDRDENSVENSVERASLDACKVVDLDQMSSSSFEFSSDDMDESDTEMKEWLEATGWGDSSFPSPEDEQRSKRLLEEELEEIKREKPTFISVQLKDGNLYEWKVEIRGPLGSPYAGGKFKLDLNFPRNYPKAPPSVNFNTKIYHCNVGSEGEVKVDARLKKLSGVFPESVSSGAHGLLLAINYMLIKCNPDDCLRPEVAAQYVSDREEHDRICREWTEMYATGESEMK